MGSCWRDSCVRREALLSWVAASSRLRRPTWAMHHRHQLRQLDWNIPEQTGAPRVVLYTGEETIMRTVIPTFVASVLAITPVSATAHMKEMKSPKKDY